MSHIWHYCVQPHHTLIGKELCLRTKKHPQMLMDSVLSVYIYPAIS